MPTEPVRPMPTTARPRRRWRTTTAVVTVVAAVLLVAGCDLQKAPPPGDAPLRYRDEVFGDVTVTSGITFGQALNQAGEQQTLALDLYEPTGDTVTARPAIVWIHGGYFAQGTRTSPELVQEATAFAKKGYVNVSIDYRVVAGGCTPTADITKCVTAIVDAKHDAQAAVRWLRANASAYGVDPTRIAAAGTSAGACTALNVGYGPEDVGESGNPGQDSTIRAAVSLSGMRLVTRADPGEAAALLFHGTADPIAAYQNAVNTVNEADAAGLDAFLTTFEGDGHVPYAQHKEQIISETTNFLWWELGLKNAAT